MIHLPEFINNNSKGNLSPVGNIPTSDMITDMDPLYGAYSDAGVTPCLNNSTVYQWRDSTPNAYLATQTVSNYRPTYKTGGSKGKPYVYFDGLNDWMRMVGTSTQYKQQDITIYCVCTVPSSLPFDQIFHKGLDRWLDNGWGLQLNGSGYNEMWVNNEGSYAATATATSTALAVRAGRFKLSATPRYLNARFNLTTQGTSVTPTTNNAPTKDAILGAGWYDSGTTTATYFYKGNMYRLLIYGVYHDDTTYNNTIAALQSIYI
jgi:hypothetical protein